MGLDDFLRAQMSEPDRDPNQDEAHPGAPDGGQHETDRHTGDSGAAEARGLGRLLGALLGGGRAGDAADLPGAPAGESGGDLGGLLGRLLGGGTAAPGEQGTPDLGSLLEGVLGGGLDINALAEQSGVSQAVIQAAVPLVLGALLQGGQPRAAGVELGAPQPAGGTSQAASFAGLAGRIQTGKPVDAQFLQATGLPQALARRTGLDLAGAISTILNILKALGLGGRSSGSSAGRARRRPGSSAATRKRKTGAGGTVRTRRSAGTGAAKHKPRPARSAARPKPAGASSARKPARGTVKSRTGSSGSARRKASRG